jgi:tRNA splicing ligase
MVYVGLYSVGTYHKKFGRENKKIKMYFAECPQMTLGKACFAECQLGDTRQRIVKDSLSSVIQLALGKGLALDKEYFNIFKKSLPSARSRALGKERK